MSSGYIDFSNHIYKYIDTHMFIYISLGVSNFEPKFYDAILYPDDYFKDNLDKTKVATTINQVQPILDM